MLSLDRRGLLFAGKHILAPACPETGRVEIEDKLAPALTKLSAAYRRPMADSVAAILKKAVAAWNRGDAGRAAYDLIYEMSLLSKIVLILTLLSAIPAFADNDPVLATSEVMTIATMAAKDEGYTINSDVYLNDLRRPDGNEPYQGYDSLGLYKNNQLIRAYAVRELTGDIVELKTCEILTYPDLLRSKRETMMRHGSKAIDLRQIASELACDHLSAFPKHKGDAQVATFSKTIPVPNLAPESFIPTSEIIRIAGITAKYNGYKLTDSDVYFDEVEGPDGIDPVSGYTSIGLYKSVHPEAIYTIRIATGDIVNTFSCKLFRSPDLLEFSRERMRLTGSAPASVKDIADELGCDHLKVVPNKDKKSEMQK
jgi:hypothetical protein